MVDYDCAPEWDLILALPLDWHLSLPAMVLAGNCRLSRQPWRDIAFHKSENSQFVYGKHFAQ